MGLLREFRTAHRFRQCQDAGQGRACPNTRLHAQRDPTQALRLAYDRIQYGVLPGRFWMIKSGRRPPPDISATLAWQPHSIKWPQSAATCGSDLPSQAVGPGPGLTRCPQANALKRNLGIPLRVPRCPAHARHARDQVGLRA